MFFTNSYCNALPLLRYVQTVSIAQSPYSWHVWSVHFIIISGHSVTLMPISGSVENLQSTQLCEGKAVQWPQHHGDNITNSYTHEKVICRSVQFSCLMHNLYDQKISDQSDYKERDSCVKKGQWKINGFGHVSIKLTNTTN